MYFFSQEYGINYAISDVIYTVCELNFKLIFQIRNYIKKSTHAIIINPSLIHRRCSSSLCWCAVFCQFVEIVALLGEYIKLYIVDFLYCFLSFEKLIIIFFLFAVYDFNCIIHRMFFVYKICFRNNFVALPIAELRKTMNLP